MASLLSAIRDIGRLHLGGSWLLAATDRHQTLAFGLLGVAAFWMTWLLLADRARKDG
jgi:hypothetical protein